MHSNEGESVSTYPRTPKEEALSNTVDVVERLHDPSTERMAPLCSAHVHLDDVPRTLYPAEGRGRVPPARRHDDSDGDVIRAGLRLSTTTL